MGRRGPPPVPTEVLKLRGSWLAKTRKAEPKPLAGAPDRPAHFTAEQAAFWDRLCGVLADIRVLTVADGKALERYTTYFLRWRKCEDFIATNGISYPVKGGGPNAAYVGTLPDGTPILGFEEYPQVRESHRLDSALRRIEQEFGLTPAARARLAVDAQAAVGPEAASIAAFTRKRG